MRGDLAFFIILSPLFLLRLFLFIFRAEKDVEDPSLKFLSASPGEEEDFQVRCADRSQGREGDEYD